MKKEKQYFIVTAGETGVHVENYSTLKEAREEEKRLKKLQKNYSGAGDEDDKMMVCNIIKGVILK